MEVEGRGRLYTYRYTVTARMTPKWGSDENHFNILLIVRDKQSHETMSTNHNLVEEKGEPNEGRAGMIKVY